MGRCVKWNVMSVHYLCRGGYVQCMFVACSAEGKGLFLLCWGDYTCLSLHSFILLGIMFSCQVVTECLAIGPQV